MIHISDANDLDQRTSITVNDGTDVGRAAKIALDDIVDKFGQNIEFPIFIDIHPYATFAPVEWMHKEADIPDTVSKDIGPPLGCFHPSGNASI